MKNLDFGAAPRQWRILPCLALVLGAGACSAGSTDNPTGTTQSNTTNNTMVIAAWGSGNALERRSLDENGDFALDQWPYTQALGQQWRLVPQSDGNTLLMNVASGKALVASGAGAALQEADVSGDAGLHWKVAYQSGGRLAVITHVATGLCLDTGTSTANIGAVVHVAACSGGSTQTWSVQSIATAPVPQVAFQFVDSASGALLRAKSDGTLTVGAAQGTRNEQWALKNNDDGTVSVTNLATNLLLQGSNGQDTLSAAAASPVTAGQTWRLSGPTQNQFAFTSASDGTCMVTSGSAVAQGTCVATGGWTLRSTSPASASDNAAANPNVSQGVNPSPTPSNVVLPWDPTTGPVIADIRQGTENDCWMLAALSTVVWTDPNFITNHIAVNADGTYTVTLIDGSGNPWRHTTGTIGSGIAYPPSPALTLAAQRTGTKGQAIFWPSLYEQAFLAYAQANPGIFQTVGDNYLDTGHEVLGYQYITGDNWYYLVYQAASDPNNDAFWTNLSYANNGVPVTLLTATPSGSSDQFADGLLGGHFYAVLKTSGTGTARTVTLRNPWGPRAPNVSDATNLGDGQITISYSTLVQYASQIQRASNTSGPP